MTNILSEKDYQKYILERLAENGYVIRKAANFDRDFAMDLEEVYMTTRLAGGRYFLSAL